MTRRAAFGIAALAILRAAEVEAQPVPQLPPVEVIGVSPLIGSGIDRNSVPAEVHTLDAAATFARRGVPDLLWSLDQEIGGVASDFGVGQSLPADLQLSRLRRLAAAGQPQGLAVYVNGMRFNQPFGDTVDWDLIPEQRHRPPERRRVQSRCSA